MQVAIVKVLGRDKHKFDIALKYCKSKLTDFRTEECRKVYMKYHVAFIIC